MERLSALLRTDEAAAAAWFDKAVYVLSDIELLPYVQSELLPRRAFASHVAGWINLTYRPAYRARLAPVAREVAEAGGLEDWAEALLIGRGYVTPHSVPTWDGEVSRMNSRL